MSGSTLVSIQIVHIFAKYFQSYCHRVSKVLVVLVVKYELSENTMTEYSGQPGRGGELITSFGDGAMNAVPKNRVDATRREEAKDSGPDRRWALAEYYQECERMMDAGRFSAKAVDGKHFVMYDQNSFRRDTALGT